MYKLKGKLIHKGDAKQVSEKFRVMDFVIETPDEKYPQKVQFQAANDRIKYNTLNAYKIESTLF